MTDATIADLIRAAVGRRNAAGTVLRERIAAVCAELPEGAELDCGLHVETLSVDCAQYRNPDWGIRQGESRALIYRGSVAYRESGSYFDGRNRQDDLAWTGTGHGCECSHADLRELAAALPESLARWIAAQHADAQQTEASAMAIGVAS